MSHVAQPPAALRQLLWQQSLMKAWTGPLLFSPTQRTYHQPPTCISRHRVQVYSPSMLNVLQLTYSWTHKNTHVHFACIYTQVIDLFSQLLKEDELSKHSNADLHSLIIHKAAKLRDVNFINGEGGDTSCIIEKFPSHTRLTRTRRRMQDVEGWMDEESGDKRQGGYNAEERAVTQRRCLKRKNMFR